MNTNTYTKLEFNQIRERISEFAKSEEAKNKLLNLEPMLNPNAIRTALDESDDGKRLAEDGFRVPVHSLNGVQMAMKQISKEAVLTPQGLQDLGEFLHHASRMKTFMLGKKGILRKIADYAYGIDPLDDIAEQLQRAIKNGRVSDQASSKLSKIRKNLGRTEARIREKMDKYLVSSQLSGKLQDDRYKIIDGQFVLPVKRANKNAVDGRVVSHSNKGTTAYVQPEAISRLQNELEALRADEKSEEYRILSELTNSVATHTQTIMQNIDIMIQYDIILAKGRYSREIGGERPQFNNNGVISLIKAKHPLLGDEAVPLNIRVGDTFRSLVITGPNTGGKTVVLKTTGLSCLMAQSGLHIACDPGSTLPLYEDILVDIGDNQNIEQSLSTFSAHIKNIIGIVKYGRKGTLVLLDEIGTGTDPVEGTGLGISILEKLHEQGATVMATTHFSEIKTFAKSHEGFQTGSMAFDVESLRPLYRLDIGKPGESNAFLIALRLGLDYKLIERAHEASYGEKKTYANASKKFKEHMEDKTIDKPAYDSGSQKRKVEAKKVRKQLKNADKALEKPKFDIGDAVKISGLPAVGVIVEEADRKGEYLVLYKNKKIRVMHTRLSIYIGKEQLYPDQYDMDNVTKSWNRRKKESKMRKGKIGVTIDENE
ncbi:endonuclease MutS2 [Fusibacter sp. JL216-2]|uniref:endonuclease MutS2 n=1 Tax=Fusibacter sp. JL216-2 TaxID=3071453 RepID=UPI003D352AC7